ncbi:MAG: hypothetical protein JJ934_05165 [Pseudomonadales bacterium]|nr:hypothetical protein [Pseudomonadales bacterium]
MSDYDPTLTNRVIGHGLLVLFVGLIAGVMLVFSLLGAIELWPIPGIEADIPGSTRGWQAAHVGGIMNGIMLAGIALLMKHFQLTGRKALWVGWGMIITGWGNTLFYWAGNLSANRGLSVTETPFGQGDIWGALAFFGGGIAMFFTFVAIGVLVVQAFGSLRDSSNLTSR